MRKTKFIALLTIGSLLTFGLTGCKDYDSDIAGLQTQIDELKADIKKLPDFAKNKFVSNIEANEEGGFKVTFTDGSTFTTTNVAITLGVATNGNFTINGKDTGVKKDLVFGEEDGYLTINGVNTGVKKGASEPTETTIDYTDDGFLIINGKQTQVNKNALLTVNDPKLEFGSEDGEFTINGVKTGVSMTPTPGGDKHEYVTATESADGKGYTFTRYDADGKKIDDFTLPKSRGAEGGIKSLVFSPQFTLDGKPAIYGQAIIVDTSATGGFGKALSSTASQNLTIYGNIAINFKVNPTTFSLEDNIEQVEVFVVTLDELRAKSAESLINGEKAIVVRENYTDDKEKASVTKEASGVLTVKLSHTVLDTLNKWVVAPTGIDKDKQKYLAVVLNGDIASAYIPYVSEDIPSAKIFIGESRGAKGYVRYGVNPGGYNKDDSINVINYDYEKKSGKTERAFNPVLIYDRSTNSPSARSVIPLLGFDPTWTYKLLEVDGKNKDLYTPKTASGNDVDFSTVKLQDEVIKVDQDSVRVQISFSLANALTAKNAPKPDYPQLAVTNAHLDSCLMDSTNNVRVVRASGATEGVTDAYYGNALVKVRSRIKLIEPKSVTWWNGADSIRGKNKHGSNDVPNGIIIDKTQFLVTISPDVTFPNGGGSNTNEPYVYVRKSDTPRDRDDKYLNKETSGIGWTTNSAMRDSLVASAGIDAVRKDKDGNLVDGEYVATWEIDGVPGITYYADYNLTVKNPSMIVKRDLSYWNRFSADKNTQVAPGDTLYDGMYSTFAAGGPTTKWGMVSLPSRGFNTDASDPDYDGNLATCGTNLEIKNDKGHFVYSIPKAWNDVNNVTSAGTDSAVVVRELNWKGKPEFVVAITNKQGVYNVDPTGYGELGVGSREVAKKFVTEAEENRILLELAVNFQDPATLAPLLGVGGKPIKLPVEISDIQEVPELNQFYLRFMNPLVFAFDSVKGISTPTTGNGLTEKTARLWGYHIKVSNKYDSETLFNAPIDSVNNATGTIAGTNIRAGLLRDKIYRYFSSVTASRDGDDPLSCVTVIPMQGDATYSYGSYYGPAFLYDSSAGATLTDKRKGSVNLTFVTSWGEVLTGIYKYNPYTTADDYSTPKTKVPLILGLNLD